MLDWLVQPKPRWLGGNGWLLDGPEEVLQGKNIITVKFELATSHVCFVCVLMTYNKLKHSQSKSTISSDFVICAVFGSTS